MHPRTEKFLRGYGLFEDLASASGVRLTRPLGYLEFLKLMAHSRNILTDSGGVQKEAYIFLESAVHHIEGEHRVG